MVFFMVFTPRSKAEIADTMRSELMLVWYQSLNNSRSGAIHKLTIVALIM